MRKTMLRYTLATLLAGASALAAGTLTSVPAYAAQTVPDGIYTLTETVTGKLLDVKNGSMLDGAAMQLYTKNDTTAQSFILTYQAKEDAYTIRNLKSGKLVEVKGANAGHGSAIDQYDCVVLPPQLWSIEPSDDTGYCIKSRENTDCYLGKSASSDKAILTHGVTKWHLDAFESGQVLADGEYFIQKLGTNKVVDIVSEKESDGHYAWLFPYNGNASQRFNFAYDETDGTYTITNSKSGLVLDRRNGTDGTDIWQYAPNGTGAQKWRMYKTPNGRYMIFNESGYKGFATKGKTPSTFYGFNTYECTLPVKADSPEIWNIYPTSNYYLGEGTYGIYSAAGSRTQTFVQKLPNKMKKITTTQGFMALDIKNASKSNKANVQLYASNGTLAQRFIFKRVKDGYYTITNVATGKLLDVANASRKKGANVWQYKSNGTSAQQWKVEFDSNGYATISNRLSSMSLDIKNASYKNSTNVQMWEPNNTKAQKWYIIDQNGYSYTATETEYTG